MLMEQEVPVTIRSGKPKELQQEPLGKPANDGSGISDTVDHLLASISEGDFGLLLRRSAHKTREYIANHPGQAMAVSAGIGALFGLLLKKRR